MNKKLLLIVKDKGSKGKNYLLDEIVRRWSNHNFRIGYHFGTNRIPRADIVFIHIDKTKVPQLDSLSTNKGYVVNGNVTDISKQIYSQLQVDKNDEYQGSVIIKTNRNFGGIPEAGRFQFAFSNLFKPFLWNSTTSLNPYKYPIFETKLKVPSAVWGNPGLIVEKFLPEKEDGIYFVRSWVFLGDQSWTGRYGSRNPIVKFNNMVAFPEQVSVPLELVELRKKLKIDYGRMDFILHNNEPFVLDVNKTIGCATDVSPFEDVLTNLARGLDYFVQN